MFWPSFEDAVRFQEEMVRETGGSVGVRDRGALEAALFRPLHTFGGADLFPSLEEKAAALIHGVITSHPFLDGNKRTAMQLGLAVMLENGRQLDLTAIDDQAVEDTAVAAAVGELGVEQLARWLGRVFS